MGIRPRIGKCIDCTAINEITEKPLMAKRCLTEPHFHYQNHQKTKYINRSLIKKSISNNATKEQNNGLSLGTWFNQQINIMPKSCENCGEYLNPYAPWSSRAYIAHIVAKRYFKSVMVHPMNRVFLCIDCHTKFDNSLSREVIVMKCWPIVVDRFNKFIDVIEPSELKHLPPCFESLLTKR